MRARINTKPIIVAVLSITSVYFLDSETAWSQQPTKPTVGAEVFTYGNEQAMVNTILKRDDHPSSQEFQNDLDFVFSVLLTRAYPTPKADHLIQQTINAICKEVESTTHNKVTDSQRNRWVTTATKTKSFEPVLKDIKGPKREQLINIGLIAMLRATVSKFAGILNARNSEWITKMAENRRNKTSKEPGMLGLDVGKWPTIQVLPNTAAAKAGLQNGDIVLRVDTKDIAETESAAEGLKALKGPAGTTINLTIKRGSKTLTFEVRRASPADRISAIVLDPTIIYIQIPTFEGSGIAKRVNELLRKHITDTTSTVILDLRNNPGGRAEEANGVADIFLDKKCLQIFQFRNDKRIAFISKPGAIKVRPIVLINGCTGSGAEMLALALHDNLQATLIGQPTAGALFGKDFEKLSDGRMIIFRSEPTVLSPTGRDYSQSGVPPDILVPESKDSKKDNILNRAIQSAKTGPKQKEPPTNIVPRAL
jgi:C-terminal peptidase prc